VGVVRRVFGPVSCPYITVTPIEKSVLVNISGKKVYFERVTQHGKNKRRS
jgi:rRNA processing protein Gar1